MFEGNAKDLSADLSTIKKFLGSVDVVNLVAGEGEPLRLQARAASDDKIIDLTTDLECSEKNTVAVPFDSLVSALKGRAGVKVSASGTLDVSAGKYRASIATETPNVVSLDDATTVSLSAEVVSAVLKSFQLIMIDSNTLHDIPVHIQHQKGRLKIISVDSVHGAYYNVKMKNDDFEFVLTQGNVRDLAKLTGGGEAVDIAVSDRIIAVQTSKITARLPRYVPGLNVSTERIMEIFRPSKQTDRGFSVAASALRTALSNFEAVRENTGNIINVSATKTIKLDMESSYGKVSDTIKPDSVLGACEFKAAYFNITDIISRLAGTVTVTVADNSLFIRPDDEPVIYIVQKVDYIA